jgi:small GTP-binding protein
VTAYATVVKKICLIGPGSVGKTSLIRRYIYDEFEDKYQRTVGTKVSKKVMRVKHPKKDLNMNLTLLIWDIMGQETFRPLLEDSYFYGASGCLAVCDSTRMETLDELKRWVDSVHKVVGDVPLIILVNKKDLIDRLQVDEETIKKFSELIGSKYMYTSVKTGDNVEKAFNDLVIMLTSNIDYDQ